LEGFFVFVFYIYIMKNRIYLFEDFLLEKRIGQISANVEIRFGFDIIKTSHATTQADFSKRGLQGDNQNHISNLEIKEFVLYFIKDIASAIATGEIVDQDNFVIRSVDREMSIPIVAVEISKTYWQLVVKTVFRESNFNQLKIAKDQLVFDK
jgi:hypothetical protein